MHPQAVRVVHESQPYLLTRGADGAIDHAHGPFAPGTEPSLSDCTDENEVRDPAMLSTLAELVAISPTLPSSDDTLAGG